MHTSTRVRATRQAGCRRRPQITKSGQRANRPVNPERLAHTMTIAGEWTGKPVNGRGARRESSERSTNHRSQAGSLMKYTNDARDADAEAPHDTQRECELYTRSSDRCNSVPRLPMARGLWL